MLLETGTVTISAKELKALCDSAEAQSYPTGPLQQYWERTDLPPTLEVHWVLHKHCGRFGEDELVYSRNSGLCARIFADRMRADIDLADWSEWLEKDFAE